MRAATLNLDATHCKHGVILHPSRRKECSVGVAESLDMWSGATSKGHPQTRRLQQPQVRRYVSNARDVSMVPHRWPLCLQPAASWIFSTQDFRGTVRPRNAVFSRPFKLEHSPRLRRRYEALFWRCTFLTVDGIGNVETSIVVRGGGTVESHFKHILYSS